PKMPTQKSIKPFKEAIRSLNRSTSSIPIEDGGPTERTIKNPDRYSGKLKEQLQQRLLSSARHPRFAVARERDDTKEAREFLYQEYDGRCQVTGETFRKSNGRNYFVAVSLASFAGADYLNDPGNMLCLSAETAARFLYGDFEWADDVEEKI